MECERIRADLSAMRDGAVERAQREEIEEHLAGCAACRAELAAIEDTASMLGQLAPEPLGEREVQGILAGVHADAGTVVRGGRAATPLRRAASLAVAFAAGVAATTVLWLTVERPGRGPADGELVGRASEQELPGAPASGAEDGERPLVLERLVVVPELVPVRVEVPVPVTVEVPVATPVEVRVEVPVVDPTGTERLRVLASALDLTAAGLRRSSAELRAHPVPLAASEADGRGPSEPDELAARSAPASPRSIAEPVAWAPPSTLRIERDGPTVSLVTRGTVSEVVPALIERLDDEDPVVRALVHDRLDAMRDELQASAEWADRLAIPAAPEARGTQSRAEDAEEVGADDPQAWQRWWEANEMLVVAYEARRPVL